MLAESFREPGSHPPAMVIPVAKRRYNRSVDALYQGLSLMS